MKKSLLIFVFLLLATWCPGQTMPIFRNAFTTNVPGAYVRGDLTFGTGGTGLFNVEHQLNVIGNPAGGLWFFVGTNYYGTGTPWFLVSNGVAAIGGPADLTASLRAYGNILGSQLTSQNAVYAGSGSYYYWNTVQTPRLGQVQGGFDLRAGTGATNLWTLAPSNGVPVVVVRSNGHTGILTNNPQSALHVHGRVSSTNFYQAVPSWDDVRIPLITLSNPSAQPGKVSFAGGLTVFGFDAASTEQLDFELQIPHGINTNNAYGVRLHLHWTGASAPVAPNTNVVWGLEYAFANPFEVFSTTTITNRITNGLAAAYTHTIAAIITITNVKESGVLVGRLFREGGNASDNYPADALGLSLDAHYPRIQLGSSEEYGDY